MTKVSINGISFDAADGEPSDFGCFTEGHPKATDTAPWGMVEEMKAFIRIQDEHKLRNLVDVGALFGVFSLVFAARYRDAKSLAIEPSPWAFEDLCQNVMLNPDAAIFPLNAFCGQRTGLSISCGRQWRHIVANRFPDSKDYYPTSTFALDDIAGAQSCDCIKIDVEGYECPVLRGAKLLIARQRPIIFLEAHFSVLKEVSGDSNESLYELIQDLGYTAKTFQGETVKTFDGVTGHRYVLWPNK